MLYITAGALEHCSADKAPIRIVCPDVWIHYVTDGHGYYNGQRLGAGQAFIVYKNDLCEYYPDRDDPWTYVWARFSGSDDEGLIKSFGLPLYSGVFEFDYKDRLSALAPTVFSELSRQRANTAFARAAAKMILSMNFRCITDTAVRWDERWVNLAKEYIAFNYHRFLTVEEIAAALHLDRQYLRNLFVKYTGISTKRYLDGYRMKKAADLLMLADISIGTVAMSVGYPDQLSFSKAFKKRFGVSPSKYRKQA